jgi:ankyrin repeat protein
MTLLSDAIDDADPIAIHEALQTSRDDTILIYLMTHSPRLSTLIQIIQANPSIVNRIDDDTDMTPLHYAVQEDSFDMVHFLLENGAEINAQDGAENTPLHYSVNSPCITHLLLLNGADPNLQNEEGNTPLHRALLEDAPFEIILLLLSKGADPTIRNEDGYTSLAIAVRERKDTRLLDTLVIHGADPRQRDAEGISLLQYARAARLQQAAEWLEQANE